MDILDIFLEDLLKRTRRETNLVDERIEQEITSLWTWGIKRVSDRMIQGALYEYLYTKVPYQFFISSSSATGKHHPEWHNVPGGTVRHLTECCVAADRLIRCFGYEDGDGNIDLNARDIVLAATVITDTQKNGIPWGDHSVRNHGEIAADIWREVASGSRVPHEFYEAIAKAVHWHYGRYTPVPEGYERAELRYLHPLTQIVHLLDACSSNYDYELIYKPVERIPASQNIRGNKGGG